MNTIVLHPTDVLFFRDGRPMTGAHSGHGAAWPLPHVIDSALHAALWRGGLKTKSHGHGQSASFHFGGLKTAGPFPVRHTLSPDGALVEDWYFPRPRDAGEISVARSTHFPSNRITRDNSNLPKPLRFGVISRIEPSKEEPANWWSRDAWTAYLNGAPLRPHFLRDDDFAVCEHSIGIGIDPATGTTGRGDAEGQIYSAQYLRLKETSSTRWGLGVLATCGDKGSDDRLAPNGNDLLEQLIKDEHGGKTILVGGQQRSCNLDFRKADASAKQSIALPRGIDKGFRSVQTSEGTRWFVKWVLLTPAVWPEIKDITKTGAPIHSHPGGWLPNWIFVDYDPKTLGVRDNPENGSVKLKLRTGAMRRRFDEQKGRHIRSADHEFEIKASLVAAITGKPIPITGWSIQHEAAGRGEGAKHTHLAVPAGSVYYFECDTELDATNLAAALNWHGAAEGTEIKNRRSTIMGEKGFGLGVCGTWHFVENDIGHSVESNR